MQRRSSFPPFPFFQTIHHTLTRAMMMLLFGLSVAEAKKTRLCCEVVVCGMCVRRSKSAFVCVCGACISTGGGGEEEKKKTTQEAFRAIRLLAG